MTLAAVRLLMQVRIELGETNVEVFEKLLGGRSAVPESISFWTLFQGFYTSLEHIPSSEKKCEER